MAENIILKNRDGTDEKYPIPLFVKLNADDGTEITYIDTANTEKTEESVFVPLDMSEGNQTVLPSEGKTLSEVIIEKPPEFNEDNIVVDITIGGVTGKAPKPKLEEVKNVEPNFSAGNHTITATDPNAVLSRVELIKPSNLTSPNVRENENICGIVGSMKPAKPEESVTMSLDMVNGNQVVLPTSGKVLTKVEILKDPDHKAENILKGKVIGKVEGNAEAGGGEVKGQYKVTIKDFDGTPVGVFGIDPLYNPTGWFERLPQEQPEEWDKFTTKMTELQESRQEIDIDNLTPAMQFVRYEGTNRKLICDIDVGIVWNVGDEATMFWRANQTGIIVTLKCDNSPAAVEIETSWGETITVTEDNYMFDGEAWTYTLFAPNINDNIWVKVYSDRNAQSSHGLNILPKNDVARYTDTLNINNSYYETNDVYLTVPSPALEKAIVANPILRQSKIKHYTCRSRNELFLFYDCEELESIIIPADQYAQGTIGNNRKLLNYTLPFAWFERGSYGEYYTTDDVLANGVPSGSTITFLGGTWRTFYNLYTLIEETNTDMFSNVAIKFVL